MAKETKKLFSLKMRVLNLSIRYVYASRSIPYFPSITGWFVTW